MTVKYTVRMSIVSGVNTWRVWQHPRGIIVAQFKTEEEAHEWVKKKLEEDSGSDGV
jgi:hypothetical protein